MNGVCFTFSSLGRRFRGILVFDVIPTHLDSHTYLPVFTALRWMNEWSI